MKVIGWQLARLVAEAQDSLVGGSIEQVRRSPDRTRLALVVGSRRGKRYVIAGVRGESAAFYWTAKRERIPGWGEYERTEAFNRLRSAQVIGVGMALMDRVVRLEFERPASEDQPVRQLALVLGWIGGPSNIWLVDSTTQHVLERFHAEPDSDERRSKSESAELKLPPAPDLADWRTMTFPQYRAIRQGHAELPLNDFLRRCLWGIDSGLARQVAEKRHQLREASAHHDSPSSQDYWEEFQALVEVGRAALDPDSPLILEDGQYDPAEVRLATNSPGAGTPLAEWLAVCDSLQPRKNTDTDERGRLFTAIETAMKKTERRLVSIDRTLAEEGRAAEYKRLGDLLGASRHTLRKGQSHATVEDWQSGNPVEIVLNPARSPQQNIDDYYRKSRKAADAIAAARAERPHVLRERERLRAALQRLESEVDVATAPGEIAASLGWDTQPKATGKDQTAPRLPYREFVVGKDRFWVGRSSRDNDELTLRFARPHDLFFHVHGSPGSHVILKRESKDASVDKDTITQAAQIAAFFSKSKHAGLVPVVYAEARFVRKPRKAPAGTVSVEREKTVMVRPIPPPGYHEKNPPK